MLTKKAKYALKALAHLANYRPGDSVGVRDIAVAENIPKKFLDTILCELRTAGFVEFEDGQARRLYAGASRDRHFCRRRRPRHRWDPRANLMCKPLSLSRLR